MFPHGTDRGDTLTHDHYLNMANVSQLLRSTHETDKWEAIQAVANLLMCNLPKWFMEKRQPIKKNWGCDVITSSCFHRHKIVQWKLYLADNC